MCSKQRGVWAWRAASLAFGYGVLIALSACGGGGGDGAAASPPPVAPSAVAVVSGVVASSATGQPLAGVVVSSGNRSTTTDGQGRYSLNDVPAAERTVVAFSLNGYVRGAATVALPASSTALASPRLVPIASSQTFDAASAATVTVAGSPALVVLPAGGLVTASGVAATGAVTARVTPINPAADPGSMPGNYQARSASGALQGIESFGALSVTLIDAGGGALNLGPGRTATIRIPLASRSANAPATIPLYWFNEQTGLWVEEGTASLQGAAPNQYYEGTVSHFTVWNADRPLETIFVRGCVQDANGVRVPGVWMQSVGRDYTGSSNAFADASGNFQLPMRRGGTAAVFGEEISRATNVLTAGPSTAEITLPSCLVLGAGGQAPQLLQSPESLTVQEGDFAFLAAQAVGSAPLSYQWRRNGIVIAGAVSAVYLLNPVTAADNGASFTVVVSNGIGSVTSSAGVLTVTPVSGVPPTITQAPRDATVQVGESASFSVLAQSNGGALTYQWQRNGMDIPGASDSTYTTPVLSLADNGSTYRAVVLSTNGTQKVSGAATVTVVSTPVAPTIAQQPANASVNVGQSASFQVGATGTPAPSFQWRRNGVDITGATSPGYTTPATVLADNGAQFSVLVSNAGGSATSSAATLTVQQPPPPPSGLLLVGQAGPRVTWAVSFANGVQSVDAQALLAVSPSAAAAGAITLEPAGQVSGVSPQAYSGTVSNGTVSNLRLRFTSYIKGGRFYKFDHEAQGGTPQGQLWTSLSSSAVCGEFGYPSGDLLAGGVDFQSPVNSWAFYDGPGADGQCNTGDDVSFALRLSMGGGTAPATLNGRPVVSIGNANGALTGFLMRSGTQIQQLDSDLMAVGNLFAVSSDFENIGLSLSGGAPGVWLFRDGNTLYGVNLATPTTRVALTTLAAGEEVLPQQAEDEANLYVGITRNTAGAESSRVLRVSPALAVTPVVSQPLALFGLRVTPTRLVLFRGDNSIVSVLKADGSGLVVLRGVPPLGEFSYVAATAGENVVIQHTVIDLNTASRSNSVLILGSDGGNPQLLDNTAIAGTTQARPTPLGQVFKDYAVFLASPVIEGNWAGANLRAMEIATRTDLVTYGALPATPGSNLAVTGSFDPLQYGQPGLFSVFGPNVPGQATPPDNDLYFFNSDSAGLVRVTHLIVGSSPSRPIAAGLPGSVETRQQKSLKLPFSRSTPFGAKR